MCLDWALNHFAEASFRGIIRVARNVIEDIGAEAASSSGGLTQLAAISLDHSERDGHQLLGKAGLSVRVPLAMLGSRELNLDFRIIPLRHWAQWLANSHNLHILVGLQAPDDRREGEILKAFWDGYRQLFPQHTIFNHFDSGAADPGLTYPITFHGDEGRGRRRLGFLVTNYHSYLGRGTDAARTQCPQRYIKLRPNFLGHTQTTRFLHAAVPKKLYQKDGVFDAIMENATQEALYMINSGVLQAYTGRRVFMAMLSVCGDWMWLHKAGSLSRSYNNVPKRLPKTGVISNLNGICHRCCAGQDQVPWETIHERDPAWLRTCFSESAFATVPSICNLHHIPGQEEGMLAYDVFHSFHLGVGKSFVGSCLALLADEQPATNIDDKFKLLEADFFGWCRSARESPILTKLSKDTIQWQTRGDYPQGSWYKASVTTTFMKYLEHTLCTGNFAHEPMLVKAGEAASAMNAFFRDLYLAEVFIPPAVAIPMAESGLRFLRRFAWLSAQALKLRKALWLLTPKAHVLHHLLLEDTLLPAKQGKAPLNILCHSVQQDEDFIGRPSRLSRKVEPRHASLRCIQRHLESSYSEFVKAGYIIPDAR